MESLADYVDDVLVAAAETLKLSFSAYWPTFGNTGAPERNLSLHIASGFLRAGFAVFGEAHREGAAVPRYDVLAYSDQHDLFVAVECKHLWKGSVASDMRDDVERLLRFEPVRRRHRYSPSTVRFGLVAAFSEDDARFRQLIAGDRTGRCKATSDLLAAIPSDGKWKFRKVSEHGRHPDRPGPLHLVYSLFSLPEPRSIEAT